MMANDENLRGATADKKIWIETRKYFLNILHFYENPPFLPVEIFLLLRIYLTILRDLEKIRCFKGSGI